MSTLLSARGLSLSRASRALFTNLDLAVRRGDRIGLVGHNGSGKSSLLALLGCAVAPDAGQVEHAHAMKLAVVEQFLPDTVATRGALDAVMDAAAGPAREERYRGELLLVELGLDPKAFERPAGDLSGGQQNRVMLARAMIGEPDLLLLDEPSNHIDLATLSLFERFLLSRPSLSWLLVSHDRRFLDRVTNRTLFLRDGQLQAFDLPFSRAREALAERDEQETRAAEVEQREIQRLKASAKRLAIWGREHDNEKFSRRARSMERQIERLEAQRTEPSRGNPLNLELQLGDARSARLLHAEGLQVRAGGAADAPVLFEVDQLTIRPGERLALLGPNGARKSSLIRTLLAADTESKALRLSPQCRVGYYDQELAQVSDARAMAIWLADRAQVSDERARQTLIHAGFPFDRHATPVEALSGGERARLLFLVQTLTQPNFLVLDEPTNHIDIEGREELEAQLLSSGAALLVTSHDRDFIETVAQRFLLIDGDRLIEIPDPAHYHEHPEASGRSRQDEPVREKAGAHPDANIESVATSDAERALERIVELETLLEADRGRKARFQKPERQQAWQQELKGLYRQLDAAPED